MTVKASRGGGGLADMTLSQFLGLAGAIALGSFVTKLLLELDFGIRAAWKRVLQRRRYPALERRLRLHLEVELSKLPIGPEHEADNARQRASLEDRLKAQLDLYRHECGMPCLYEVAG